MDDVAHRLGDVSFFTAAITTWESLGLCPVSINTTPSGSNDRGIGFVEHRGVNVDAFLDLLKLRAEILRDGSSQRR